MAIKGMEKIEKRNIVNEIRRSNMTLQELRFFSIYLSKINARDISTRIVRFTLDDFQKIMEMGRMNIQHFKKTVDSLLCNIVHLSTPTGGLLSFQLFKECFLEKDEFENWYIEIDAHDRALPLLFEFKNDYFTYELWNCLSLTSSNQLRMYEILKQYEHIGERKLSLLELKDLIGLSTNEYLRWSDFKTRVLDSCKTSLVENTDIKFTYDLIKNGRGGKVTGVKFTIMKNENHKDKLKLNEFLGIQQLNEKIELEEEKLKHKYLNPELELLADACDYEFSETQMQEIFLIIAKENDISSSKNEKIIEIARYQYLQNKYAKLNTICEQKRNEKKPIKNRFSYFKKML